MKRNYECMVLLDNREVRNGWQQLKDQVTSLFQKHGAEIKSARRWDERPLAYPINGHTRATYLHMAAVADTDQVTAVRRDLQFADSVLRNLILQVDEFPPELHEPEEEFDEAAVPLGDEPPAPEEESSDGSGEGEGEAKAEAKDEAKAETKAEAKDGEAGESSDDDKAKESGEPAQAATASTDEGDTADADAKKEEN